MPKPGAFSEAWDSLELSKPLRRLLDTGQWDATPRGFRIIALSFLADGCVGQADRDAAKRAPALVCVDRCIELAERTRPKMRAHDPTEQGLWMTHYALLLGARDRLGTCFNPQKHETIVTALADRTRQEPTYHIPSFPGVAYRWPADQTAALAGLARYDRGHGTHLADEPIKLWRAWVLEHAMDPKLALPWSEATGKTPGAKVPRGCALSWQIRYLREFDQPLAARWYDQYKSRYLVDWGILIGLREWPPGFERPADMDSGPIVHGMGASATALGIAAARSQGDLDFAARLETTVRIGSFLGKSDRSVNRQANTVLSQAILYLGAQIQP